MLQRHSANTNLHMLHYSLYNGLKVQEKYLPMVTEYLDALHATLKFAINENPRVFAFRVDPVIPTEIYSRMTVEDHQVLNTKFIASLKAITEQDWKRRRQIYWLPPSKMRYVWCREVGANGKLHNHFFLIFNRDVYFTVGEACSLEENLFNRVSRAWYSALGVKWNRQAPWIHIPENAMYLIYKDDPESFQAAFYRASYLCKAKTKQYGLGLRAFGNSQN